MTSMRMRHIEIFYAVYSTGSISNAARMLNVTQPTVSQILRHAEDQLGYNLFHRIRGRLVPTEEAELLYVDTQEIYKLISALRHKARNLKKTSESRLRVAAVPSLGLQMLPRAIANFGKTNAGLEFDVQIHNHSELLSALNSREKDMGLVVNCPDYAGFSKRKLGSGEMVCIFAQTEFDKYPDRLKLADLQRYPFVGVSESGPVGDLFSDQLAKENIELESTITTQTLYVARDLVSQGAGISVVDEFTARSVNNNLSFKGFDPAIKFSVEALYLEDHQPSKMAEKFLSFIKSNYLGAELTGRSAPIWNKSRKARPA